MMSEKRLASSGDSFVDLTEMQIVDLLNKLSDENTRLHKKVDEQQATINELKEEMVRLHKMSIELMDRVIPNLRRENEQLRQQHQRLYNYFRDYLEEEMSAENFGEMWDNVKKDERWE